MAAGLTPTELEALGLYDPAAPEAEQKLELLDFLIGLGATRADLVAYHDALPGLASVLCLRGGPAMTLSELVEHSGLPEHKVRELIRVAGFAEPGSDDRVFSERFLEVARTIAAAEALFGEQAVLQLVRVIGSAVARIADAVVSAFLVNVEPATRGEDPVGLALARANADAAGLVPTVVPALEVLLREHLIAARRTLLGDRADEGFETQSLCVGFIDLVDSTGLGQRLSTADMAAMLSEFESVAADTVTSTGGRVVKLIGDEILFTATDAGNACGIALELARVFARHRVIPSVRAGLAGGDVLLRDGDVFGPVVNLAARAVKVAPPGAVVATSTLVEAAGVPAAPLGRQLFKGFGEEVELYRLLPGP